MKSKVLEKAVSGDRKAFEAIYNEYFDGLWRYVYSRLGDPVSASDVMADSFAVLFENIGNLQNPLATKAYLYKIAKSKMIKLFSAEKTVSLDGFDCDRLAVDAGDKDSGDADRRTTEIRLEKVLSRLPERYQEVLRLRYLASLKIREVAEIMDTTEGNVKVLQNRALKKARAVIFKDYNLK